jgi:hypothetical protein
MSEVKDALRQFWEPVLEGQTEHPVYGRFDVLWDEPYDMGSLPVVTRSRRGAATVPVRMASGELDQRIDDRERIIREEKADPYRHGYEPAIWRETDWRLAMLRVAYPGVPITLAALGGNGGGKSYYCAKRYNVAMVENDNWLMWQLSLDEDSSCEIPQRIIYDHLPEEYRSTTGKLKKTAQTKLSYNVVNGFTDNTFSLDNGSRSYFKFYGGGDVNALEGPRPDCAWADEMVPPDWVRACLRRLMTKAEQTHKIIPQLRAALAERQRIIDALAHNPAAMQAALDEAWHQHIRPLLPKLLQGVLMISFTPKNGYTRTVAMLTAEADTLEECEAELLPIMKDGRLAGYEKVPRVMWHKDERAVVMFFHIYDNPFGGNWEGQKVDLAKRSREEILWRAYGVATKIAGAQLAKFKKAAHVRPVRYLPKKGTWYHIADPCTDGRNWFMIWAKVCPNPIGKPLKFIAREWPQQGDWIKAGNVGNPGPWAVLEESGNADGRKKAAKAKADGERGPAQFNWGLGFRQYAEEIERVERELFRLERQIAGDPDWEKAEGRIEIKPGNRIMDSHAANTETQTHSEALTLIQTMEDYGLFFVPSGRDSGAEAGSTTIKEGVSMMNDSLFYDEDQVELGPEGHYIFHGQAPTTIIADCCTNLIFAAGHWTGQDGGQGATKDPIDTLRYLEICNPVYLPPIPAGSNQAFGY